MGSGEKPIEPGHSWLSPKSLSGEPPVDANGGRALDGHDLVVPNQTPNTVCPYRGVRTWGINSMLERETTQTAS